MRVIDVMSENVEFVTADTKVDEVCRLIFGRRINGLPVCKGKKVTGFVTERDVLSKFYPSMQEYMDDPVYSRDFEEMEKKAIEILSLTAKDIMCKNPLLVRLDTPLLKAHSLMLVNKVGRLPVVDKDGNLVGMISKGDIFRVLVGGSLQFVEDEEYHDWLSRHYDMVIKWEQRLGNEIPDLVNLFRKEDIKKVLDIGCGTGSHDIALAKEGFDVVGFDRSTLMYETSREKWLNLPVSIKNKLEFVKGEYKEVLKKRLREYGAAIFMGNALPHNSNNHREVLEAVSKSLFSKNSLMVLQIVNIEKVLKTNKRFQEFSVAKVKNQPDKEYLFLQFYDPPRKPRGHCMLNMAILYYDGKKWHPKSNNSTPIVYLDRDKIKRLLHKFGFSDISFYGGMILGDLFKHPFDPANSDWLNIVAKR